MAHSAVLDERSKDSDNLYSVRKLSEDRLMIAYSISSNLEASIYEGVSRTL